MPAEGLLIETKRLRCATCGEQDLPKLSLSNQELTAPWDIPTIQLSADGKEIRVAWGMAVGGWIQIALAAVFLTVAIVGVFVAPSDMWPLPAIFGAGGGAFLYQGLAWVKNRTVLRLDGSTLLVGSAPLPWPGKRSADLTVWDGVLVAEVTRSGAVNWEVYLGMGGAPVERISRPFRLKQEAVWVAGAVERWRAAAAFSQRLGGSPTS